MYRVAPAKLIGHTSLLELPYNSSEVHLGPLAWKNLLRFAFQIGASFAWPLAGFGDRQRGLSLIGYQDGLSWAHGFHQAWRVKKLSCGERLHASNVPDGRAKARKLWRCVIERKSLFLSLSSI